MGNKENEEFSKLVESVRFKTYDKKYSFYDETLNRIYKLLPKVDKKLVREASSFCSLGIAPNRAVEEADWQPVKQAMRKGGDVSINPIGIPIPPADEDEYKDLWERRVDCLMKQIKLCEELELFPEHDDDGNPVSYQYFDNDFCERIFGMLLSEEKDTVRRTAVPYPRLLFALGFMLIELNNADEAEKVLAEAAGWNLTDTETLFEYSEAQKRRGDFDGFLETTKRAWMVSYTAEAVARCFRNFAFYFAEKKEWQKAYACLCLSTSYVNDEEKISDELQYIQENAKGRLQDVTDEMLESYSDEIPLGANPDVIELLQGYCEELYGTYENRKCLEYMQYLYDLTEDAEVKKRIKEIKSGKYKK